MGGKLRVPVGAEVVVPFLDLDQDGRLDKLLEPSADCGKAAGFACQLRQSRLIVRRSQRQRLQHSEDITVVFGESYLTRPVRPDPAARLCQDQPGSCVERTAQSPYADIKDALALKLCAFEDPNMAQTAQLVHLPVWRPRGAEHNGAAAAGDELACQSRAPGWPADGRGGR